MPVENRILVRSIMVVYHNGSKIKLEIIKNLKIQSQNFVLCEASQPLVYRLIFLFNALDLSNTKTFIHIQYTYISQCHKKMHGIHIVLYVICAFF